MSQLRKNRLICPLFIVLVLSILVQLATATVTNFTVYGGEEAAKPLGLFVDDRVVIKFTVVGGESGSLLDFWIAYPTEPSKHPLKMLAASVTALSALKKENTICTFPILTRLRTSL